MAKSRVAVEWRRARKPRRSSSAASGNWWKRRETLRGKSGAATELVNTRPLSVLPAPAFSRSSTCRVHQRARGSRAGSRIGTDRRDDLFLGAPTTILPSTRWMVCRTLGVQRVRSTFWCSGSHPR
jgi:hypothetical protein